MSVDPTTRIAGQLAGTQGKPGRTPALDDEPAWQRSFRDTLAEVLDGGFRDYAEEINKKKLEEMRRELLQAMGLTEEELADLPPERREAVERMIAEQIQMRLAAEKALDAEDPAEGSKEARLDSALRALPERFAGGEVMLELLASPEEPDPEIPTR